MLPSFPTSFLLAVFTPFCNVACEYVESFVRFCMWGHYYSTDNRLVSCAQILLRRSFNADQLVDFLLLLLRNVSHNKFCLALRCKSILSVFIYRVELLIQSEYILLYIDCSFWRHLKDWLIIVVNMDRSILLMSIYIFIGQRTLLYSSL